MGRGVDTHYILQGRFVVHCDGIPAVGLWEVLLLVLVMFACVLGICQGKCTAWSGVLSSASKG